MRPYLAETGCLRLRELLRSFRACVSGVGLELIGGFVGFSSVHRRGASSHEHGDADRFADLILGCAGVERVVDVVGDAAVASDRDSD